ncbi:MAG: hypothetical protein KF874_13510 [Rhizobiaceae bacterium]|nr:hypothetical protein [Rhizobiaceae bacterium]
MLSIVAGQEELTVRHLFYLMVAAGLIEKTEAEYNNVVIRLALQLRRTGEIPYGKIVDGTRLYRTPRLYGSVQEALTETARLYRRDYWRNSENLLEVWCEKEAISGFLFEVTRDLGVPLMVTRGFSSESVVQAVAEETKADGRPLTILFVNDLDPSGDLMPIDVIRRIRFYAPLAQIDLHRVAITSEQVDYFRLPTRPTKREGNSHARQFVGDSVEVDAMPPDILKSLLRTAIERHMDPAQLQVIRAAETSERKLLEDWARYAA